MLWPAFHPLCLPHLLECSVPLLEQELITAANEFFRRTRAWREWLDDVQAIDGVKEYDVDPPVGAVLVRIEAAKKSGRLVLVGGSFEIAAQERQSSDVVTLQDRLTLKVAQAAAGETYSIFASLAPSRKATGVPDAHFNEHYDVIANGAIARVCAIPGFAFSNPGMASVRSGMFESQIGRVAALADRSFSNSMPVRRVYWV